MRTSHANVEVIYFSSASENTHRFVAKLGVQAKRIPIQREKTLQAERDYVLIVPTYGAASGKGAVPKQVIHFLNDPNNRQYLRGVISAGNSNFGATYGLAGKLIAAKCHVPLLDRFELLGTADDVQRIQERLTHL